MKLSLLTQCKRRENGVALILVIFIISLASIIVVNLTYSTVLGAQVSAQLQQSVTAEYLLKSGLNYARVLLREDKTTEDSPDDDWAKFSNGVVVPPALLGIEDKGVKLELQIRPEDAKLPLAALIPAGGLTPDLKWLKVYQNFLTSPRMNFDNDEEVDHLGHFPGRHFSPEEMLGALIDYIDNDKASYVPGGIEADIPEDTFPNEPIKRIGELSTIPGFTPNRLRRLRPYLSAISTTPGGGAPSLKVNINFAPREVLRSLDSSLTEPMIDQIVAFREDKSGPFTGFNMNGELTNITGSATVATTIAGLTSTDSKWFEVIAKIDTGSSVSFMHALVYRASSATSASRDLPDVLSFELY